MPAAVADATLEENGSIERGRPRDGPGRLVAPDGTVWETAGRGEFMNGRLHGSGRAVYVDGRVVEGEFVGGVLHGDGRRVSKDGTVWTGTFVDGKLEGTGGSIRTASGMIDEGEFHAGQLIRGTVTFPCGTVHTGSFVSGELHGEDCRVVRPNGSVQAAGAFWHGAPDVEGKCKSAGDLELVAQRAEAARWAAMARAQTERVAGLMFEMGDWPAKLGWSTGITERLSQIFTVDAGTRCSVKDMPHWSTEGGGHLYFVPDRDGKRKEALGKWVLHFRYEPTEDHGVAFCTTSGAVPVREGTWMLLDCANSTMVEAHGFEAVEVAITPLQQ